MSYEIIKKSFEDLLISVDMFITLKHSDRF